MSGWNKKWDKEDYGVVYYFEKRKLRSPPGYETTSNPKRIKLEKSINLDAESDFQGQSVLTSPSLVTLKQGSLMNMCFQYISQNIAILDSLIGLPEIIGKELFMFMLNNGVFQLHQVPFALEENLSNEERLKLQCLRVFSEAYESLVLDSLSLCYLDKPIQTMSLLLSSLHYLVELDLSGNYLDEKTLGIFCNLSRLRMLILSNCQLTDAAVQKFTLPYRMYPKKSKELQLLDLSDNIELTSNCLKCLQKFQSLRYLNISKTSMKTHPIISTIFKESTWDIKTHFASDDVYKKPGINGWAKKIMEQIYDTTAANKSSKSRKSLSFYSGKANTKKDKRSKETKANILILLRKSEFILTNETMVTKLDDNIETVKSIRDKSVQINSPKDNTTRSNTFYDDYDGAEEDLLLQYKKVLNRDDSNTHGIF